MVARGKYYLLFIAFHLSSFRLCRWWWWVLRRNSAEPKYPFQLWVAKFPFYQWRQWLTGRIPDLPAPLPCMRETEQEKVDHRPWMERCPICLFRKWLTARKPDSSEPLPCKCEIVQPHALYLHPDSLRRWWLLFILLMLTALLICRICIGETDKRTWIYQNELILGLALSSLFWFFACYQLVYRGLRRPVLSPLWRDWLPLLDKSFLSVPQRISGKAKRAFVGKRSRLPFLDSPKWRQPVYWSPTSFQGTFLKLALIDFLGSERSPDGIEADRKWSSGLVNWGIYWCAPVWVGYGWLLLLLFVPCGTKIELPLWIPSLVWTILSIIYFLNQIWLIKEMNLYLDDYDDYHFFPPAIRSLAKQCTKLKEVDFFTKLPASKTINFILTVLFALYLAILQVLK